MREQQLQLGRRVDLAPASYRLSNPEFDEFGGLVPPMPCEFYDEATNEVLRKSQVNYIAWRSEVMRKCQNDPDYKKMIESKMRTTLFAKQHARAVEELTEASRARAIEDGLLKVGEL